VTEVSVTIERLDATTYRIALPLLRVQLEEHGIELTAEELDRAVQGLVAVEGRGALLIARDGERVLGVAALSYLWTLEHGGYAAWLDELYVLPSERGRGTGSVLLSAALETARAAGAIALDLEVEASHSRVASLYLRNGFRRLSRQRFSRPLEPPGR
jgi:GNAT superfamily N-acetyltransferase